MTDVSQIERQLYILSLLSDSKKGYTLDELYKNLFMVGIDVSKKTIERDLDSISIGNFFVMEEKRGRSIYYVANKFGIENITFTASELISLHFIKELLKSYSPLDIGNIAINLVEKIISNLPQPDKAYMETLGDLLKVKESYAGLEKRLNQEIIATVRNGTELNKKLLIKYHSFNNNEITERKFDPYIIEVYEGCYHLVGYCHLRNSIRDLRISRIKDARILDEPFKRPKNFYGNYKKGRFGKLSGEEEIKLVLKFKGEAARYVKEYESAKADMLIEEGDGGLIFEKTTTMTPEIIKWVLVFGANVVVFDPKALRDESIKYAKGMLEREWE